MNMKALLGRMAASAKSSEYQDFHRASVDRFVISVASRVPEGELILDAGAGESMYRKHFGHAVYIALDYGIGDAIWDYSSLDVICDLHELPVRTASIPFILCTQTLEHVRKPEIVVGELSRVLRPGGMLFASMPFLGDAHHQEPYDFYRYTIYAVRDLLVSKGFTSLEITPMGGYYTLLVSFLQKGVYRWRGRHGRAGTIANVVTRTLAHSAFIPLRWMNRLAWILDRNDDQRYRFALGFAVIAQKQSQV
jgi:SAM-dependent methyltransferase